MKNLISLVLILFATNVFAASGSGNVSNVGNFGGYNLPSNTTISEANSQGYFTLYNNGGLTITGNTSQPLYKNGTAYQVPAGKTFHMNKICWDANGGGVMQLMHATASFSPNTAVGGLTGAVYQGGASNGGHYANGGATYTPLCWDDIYTFPASAYVGFYAIQANQYYVEVTGFESTP